MGLPVVVTTLADSNSNKMKTNKEDNRISHVDTNNRVELLRKHATNFEE